MRDLILGYLVGEHKRGRYEGSKLGPNYDSVRKHRRKIFLEIDIPQKQAKFLKNTSEGVYP